MFFRGPPQPPVDPYTALPRSRLAEARPRATSVSYPRRPAVHPDEEISTAKRHTLQAIPAETNAWNRVVSTPPSAPHQTASRPRSTSLFLSRNPAPFSANVGPPPPGHPRRLNNSDPRALLRTLDTLLDPQSQRIPEHLDVDHLMALHERDAMEREQREAIKVQARMDRAQGSVSYNGRTVFGSSLREATMYASCATVLGGYEHDLPIVVFRCVQELCRHGHHTPIRQRPPDRDRLLALISAFDSEPQFGLKTHFDSPTELAEIYGLLTTYLLALPDPILDSEMFEALWAWCILPSLRRTDFLDDTPARCHVGPDAGVRIAHLLLRLLPLPNFSLLVYMMGFFQRLPHLVTEDVGRAVIAGRCAVESNVAEGRATRAATMLRWLLDRWDAIFKELFLFSDLEQRSTQAPLHPHCPPVSTPLDPQSIPKARYGAGAAVGSSILVRRPSDGLFETAVDSESDASSTSSSPALGARLQDVTLEIAQEEITQDARLSSKRFHRYESYHGPPEGHGKAPSVDSIDSGYHSPEEPLPSPHPTEEEERGAMTYAQALHRIHLLERELERSEVAVADAISETFRAREEVKELEGRLRDKSSSTTGTNPPVLELNLDKRVVEDWQAVVQADAETLKRQLEEAKRERDAALRLVDEIKQLMGPRA
ncbi:hypothetical protein FB45DRAFT_67006 [Roridomyces roridus]|uniref:Rho-GAP domain-containing protein n=1 Tax=Roridomyces roridus TaxID=1738132 RepID=A0AAD7FKJ9_9AGAR|nr:hypothetical protein FB45DRAFT_67006 [Roridomyces roridus]